MGALRKTRSDTFVAGVQGHAAQAHSRTCPPPPPDPVDNPGGSSGSGLTCAAGTGNCCLLLDLPNQYGIVVPTQVCY